MWIANFISRHRSKTAGISIAFIVPALAVLGLALMSKYDAQMESMQQAQVALESHYSANPPNRVWDYQGVRISERKRLVVDVHVGVIPHATFIKTRNGRIRYSYMKLACPKAGAAVHNQLNGETIWINLHFHGDVLLEGACPKPTAGGMFTS